ncbi:MAG: hypothetical protein J3Q66DRAFT_88946 [Benniella sp.]|nr:MAG: hypothetical protein J3Q66DRAFT_88946 [Benniella sp.]
MGGNGLHTTNTTNTQPTTQALFVVDSPVRCHAPGWRRTDVMGGQRGGGPSGRYRSNGYGIWDWDMGYGTWVWMNAAHSEPFTIDHPSNCTPTHTIHTHTTYIHSSIQHPSIQQHSLPFVLFFFVSSILLPLLLLLLLLFSFVFFFSFLHTFSSFSIPSILLLPPSSSPFSPSLPPSS